MKVIHQTTLSETQFDQINELWNNEYPIKLKDRFVLLLEGSEAQQHFLIEDDEQKVIAWAVLFDMDTETRFSIIVANEYKVKGLGSKLIEHLKFAKNNFNAWVIDHNNDLKSNGAYYQSPLPFYLKHDFEILHHIRIDNEMIKAVKIKWQKNKHSKK
jgi:hypothetical protein